jgi:hypothetical protein
MAYTNIDDGTAYFQTALWTGDGTAGNAVTFDGNSNMQPDWVWSKRRDDAFGHVLKDTSRGGTSNNDQHLVSNSTAAESTYTNYRMDFDSDGFTLDGVGDSGFQGSGTSMVSWAWKANGGTTSSNTDGSITSTVQANTDAGFSIVTYTGNSTSGATIGHGLGVAPNFIIIKARTLGGNWIVGSTALDSTLANRFVLNSTAAASSNTGDFNAAPTSSVFQLGSSLDVNSSTKTYVAYCFADKQGFSKFGKYTGTANANGTFVYTGFKPAFLLVKNCSVVTHPAIVDNKRPGYNDANYQLYPTLTAAENTTDATLDFYSNGFKLRTNESRWNNGANIVYAAFAENPFVTSGGVPTTAK